MKSLMTLFEQVLADAGTWCRTSTTLDLRTVQRRFENEGESFLTITLPTFCKDFERALDSGLVDHTMFLSFRKHKGLPQLFGGFLDLIFDRSSGRLLDVVDHTAVFFVRQLTLMFKKTLLECSSDRTQKAYDQYVKCEKEVHELRRTLSEADFWRFDRIVDVLWSDDCSYLDREVYDGRIIPKHGPGATSERVTGNGKYDQSLWTTRLEEYFPSCEFLCSNSGFRDELDRVDFLEPDAEIPVRVITVPKTLKTPRIIAIEPTCMQYTQQSLMEIIVDRLEKSDTLQGAIGFTDQTPNQEYARIGSVTGSLATIDLSEASDRVSNHLVMRMFRNFPHLSGAVQACRSQRADVPGYGILTLAKFASMGSALCFPVEAMFFLTIILCGYSRELNRQLTKEDIKSFLGKVRVYGDDIIIPVEFVRSVVAELETFGLKVNTTKSFWNGKFRESCGKDYYDGNDVSVTYCRRNLPSHRSDVHEMISAYSLRNQCYKAGLWQTADFLDSLLRSLAPLPTVLETSPVLGRFSFLGYISEKDCPTLHRPLVRGFVVSSVSRRSKISGHGALLKFFLKRGSDPFFDPKHLERYGRPESVDIKIRWASAT